ncbi:MAG TPA: ATP-dependent DNA helicase, partial [Candidatus Binatia bacterium]|nr:ATP-dependent DNA helicase [Candidatus Binatia bacterium]
PDQAIYRFRGASSAAFQVFRRQFPQTRLVVLGKNRRSLTPVLQCAFAVVNKNPPAFAANDAAFSYRRAPLQSARDEEAQKSGRPNVSFPVESVTYGKERELEANDVATVIEETRKRLRCQWKDFAVLYRAHHHREEIVSELGGREIPFSIEAMDVIDTSEVRDLFACVAAVVDIGSDADLFRVAALPQFEVDPEQLRSALRAIAKESRDGVSIPLHSVLHSVPGGQAVLECLRDAREEVARTNAKAHAASCIIARHFNLDRESPALKTALEFIATWEKKPTTKTGELGEWIEWLDYFREAAGAIPMAANETEDAVRLISVHGAKGLEFPHVFILRANSGSFPTSYRESLVEFPPELRDPDSAVFGDEKTLNEQEERRLFYVAMTRARDSLHIYAKQGIGLRDKTPAGFMRELVNNSSLKPWLRTRMAVPLQQDLIPGLAAVAESNTREGSRLPAWLALPPIEGLASRLSASAIESYENCPLQFKFEREWKLSREVHAAMQYGAAIHRVLRTYYDSLRAGRTKSDEELLQLFLEDLEASGIQDRYQHELYRRQGTEQLANFLNAARSAPAPQVLQTEEWFEVQVGGIRLAGRIDRIDRTADGGVVIVDYKTGKARTQEDADESLQLSIYAMAAQQKWGYKVADLAFHNLDGNVPVFSRRDEFQLERARDRVTESARNIAEGKFNPKTGFHCNFCAFRGLCPAREKQAPKPTRS